MWRSLENRMLWKWDTNMMSGPMGVDIIKNDGTRIKKKKILKLQQEKFLKGWENLAMMM